MMRMSTRMVRSPPTRSKLCSCTKRRNLVCSAAERSAISSRKTVPPSAASSRPGLSLIAPVKAPRTWPNSSLSSSSSESVVQLTTTNGRSLARTPSMDLAREHVFAGAALAAQQHGRLARRGLARGLHQPDHRGAARLQQRGLVDRAAQRAILGPQSLQLQRAFDQMLDLLERERLGHVVEGAGLHRGDRVFDRGVGRHQDDQAFGTALLDLGQQLEPVHLGHPEVRQHQVERGGLDHRARLAAAFGGLRLVTDRFEERRQVGANVLLVVDYQQPGHQASRDAGSWTTKRLPTGTLPVTKIRPPCATTMSLTIASPSPADPFSAPSPYCAKRSKT